MNKILLIIGIFFILLIIFYLIGYNNGDYEYNLLTLKF